MLGPSATQVLGRSAPLLRLAAPLSLVAALVANPYVADAQAAPPAASDEPADAREKARKLYKQATAAAQRGKLDEAARLFERAAELVPHAATHVAAGRSFLASKNEVAAADHFARALALGAPEAEKADVETSLAKLREKLGWVEVDGEPGKARLDENHSMPIPCALHGLPGTRTLVFELEGGEGRVPIELVAGRAEQAQAALVRDDEPAPPPPPPPPPRSGPDPLLVGGFVGLGLGVVGGGVTVGLGLAANGAKDDFLASRTRADFDAASSLETGTNVALAVSIGAAVVGGALVGIALLVDEDAPVEATAGGAAWRF
jgi:tetratricopeptide (TPR) repeat protein